MINYRYLFFSAAIAALIISIAPSNASAEVPSQVPIQAFLTDSEGRPIDENITLEAALYTKREGGEEVFSTTREEVAVDKGILSTYLGADQTLDPGLFFQFETLFLELTINGEKLEPRRRLAMVPYAANAANAKKVAGKKLDEIKETFRTDFKEKYKGDFKSKDSNPDWENIQNIPEDVGSTLEAQSPLQISSQDVIRLAGGCSADEILQYDGSNWICTTQTKTVIKGNSPIEVTADDTVGLTGAPLFARPP